MAIVVGLIFAALAYKLLVKKIGGWAFVVAVFAFVMAAGSFASGSKDSIKEVRVQTIADLSDRISSYSGESTRNLDVVLKSKDAFNGSSYITDAAYDMQKIMREAIKTNGGGKYDTMRFSVMAKVNDQYGNTQDGRLFSVTYNMSEVDKVNFDNMNPIALLNDFTVPQITATPVGMHALREFCNDGLTNKFCTLVGTALIQQQ